MNDDYLLRYSKHIMLENIGIEGQTTLINSTILLIGLGGLGSISSQYFAASGVGNLILADFDKVELSNLQRQIIHYTEDIGQLKTISAKKKLLKINPNIKISLVENLENCLDYWVKKSDVVVDGTDNFKTRFSINTACIKNKTPLVSSSVIRTEGQLAVFKGYESAKPCYECLYPKNSYNNETCTNSGILSPVAGVMGSLQATMTLKVLLGLGELLDEKLLIVDLYYMNFRTIKLKKDNSCDCCQ